MLALCAPVLLAGSVPTVITQQSGRPFTLGPSVTPGGGRASTSASFHVEGPIGQHLVSSSGNDAVSLDAVFWQAAAPYLRLARMHQSLPASGDAATIGPSQLARF